MLEPVTMDDWDVDEPRPARAALFWPVWSWPLLLYPTLDAWHARLARDMPAVDPAVLARAHVAADSLPWLATMAVVLAALAEAAFYGMLWAARGRRLPLPAATLAVLQCGVTELFALDLLERAKGGGGPLLAWLAGPRALHAPGAAAGALAVAFGGAGLLAAARLALFAGLQARLVSCRWREAFAMTCTVWLASHLAQGWLLDLIEGRSLRP